MPNILRRLKIDEVSSVDRGAGEGVNITLLKRDDDKPADAEKPSLGTRVSEFFADLFKSPPEPDGGKVAETFDAALAGLAASVKSIVSDDSDADHEDMLAKSFAQFHEHVSPLLGNDRALQQPTDKKESPMSAILKALGLKEDASEEDALKAIAEMAKARRKENGNDKDEEDEEDEEDEDEKEKEKALKLLPESVRKQLAEGAEAKKRIEKLEQEAALVQYNKRAVEIGLPEAEGVTLQKAFGGDKEAVEKLLTLTKSGFAAAREAGAFKEFGAAGGGGAITAYEQFGVLAQKYLKDHPGEKITPEQAFAKVYQDPANKSLRIQDARESGRA